MILEAGLAHETSQATMDDLAAKWLDLAAESLSPSTLREYRRLLEKIVLPQFGSVKIRAIRPSDLDSFYAGLRRRGVSGRALSAQSVHHVHALVRRLLNQALKWGWILSNPALNASPPRVDRVVLEVPDVETVTQIINLAQERNPDIACFLRLAAITGARRGELCAIRWRDFDKSGVLSISHSIVDGRNDELIEKGTKTHASRKVVMDALTMRVLDSQRERCEERSKSCGKKLLRNSFVFSSSLDGSIPWRPHRVTLAFKRLCDELEINGVRLHDLRHFTATQMLASGVPVKTVAGRLGHANAATTLNVYAHALESSDAEAAHLLGNILNDHGDY
ncbi:MAG: site-specific integrase [Acidimicrobiales bacterium]